jgi:DNA-binding MarR family transcriptional regulator
LALAANCSHFVPKPTPDEAEPDEPQSPAPATYEFGARWAYPAVISIVFGPMSSCTVFKFTSAITKRLQHFRFWSLQKPGCRCTEELAQQVISCHDIYMNSQPATHGPDLLLKTLAEFRFELRRFLQFSECAALEAGLQPQQHQLLLQVAGAPENTAVTIAYAAERLGLKHNSAVELVDRSEREGLLERTADVNDKRRTILRVTRKGKLVLGRLSGSHAKELNELAPRLTGALNHISFNAHRSNNAEAR